MYKSNDIYLDGFQILNTEKLWDKLTLKCLKCNGIFEKYACSCKKSAPQCPYCKINENKEIILSKGFTYISGNFGRLPITVECNKCKQQKDIKWDDFKRNENKCNNCENNKRISILKEHNITPLTPILTTKNKIPLKCDICDEEFSLQWCQVVKNINNNIIICPCCRCGLSNIKGANYKKAMLLKYGFKPISENMAHELTIQCIKCGNISNRKWDNFKKGNRKCHICYPQRSSFELDIEQYLPNPQVNIFGVIPNYELDFYLSDYKLAIECNGDYWHSTNKIKDPNYHLTKYNLCKEKGIRLIQIPESEWYSNKEWFISLIKCYLDNGDFSQFSENGVYNRMYVSELVVEGIVTGPELVGDKYKYYNCGYIREGA